MNNYLPMGEYLEERSFDFLIEFCNSRSINSTMILEGTCYYPANNYQTEVASVRVSFNSHESLDIIAQHQSIMFRLMRWSTDHQTHVWFDYFSSSKVHDEWMMTYIDKIENSTGEPLPDIIVNNIALHLNNIQTNLDL